MGFVNRPSSALVWYSSRFSFSLLPFSVAFCPAVWPTCVVLAWNRLAPPRRAGHQIAGRGRLELARAAELTDGHPAVVGPFEGPARLAGSRTVKHAESEPRNRWAYFTTETNEVYFILRYTLSAFFVFPLRFCFSPNLPNFLTHYSVWPSFPS